MAETRNDVLIFSFGFPEGRRAAMRPYDLYRVVRAFEDLAHEVWGPADAAFQLRLDLVAAPETGSLNIFFGPVVVSSITVEHLDRVAPPRRPGLTVAAELGGVGSALIALTLLLAGDSHAKMSGQPRPSAQLRSVDGPAWVDRFTEGDVEFRLDELERLCGETGADRLTISAPGLKAILVCTPTRGGREQVEEDTKS